MLPGTRAMLTQRDERTSARMWGVVVGGVAAIGVLATAGGAILFVAIWTCVPEHHPELKACSPAQVPLALALVAAPCLGALGLISRLIVGFVLRRRTGVRF